MAGIVGIIGRTDIVPRLIEGMGRLSDHADDSCGLATITLSTIDVRKDVRPLPEASRKRGFNLSKGSLSIAHVGKIVEACKMSRKNAQPHLSCDEKFAVVADGAIISSRRIRANLETSGRHFFFSETDSEIVSHLIEEYYRFSHSVEAAFAEALRRIEGNFAIALISNCESPRIFCAHNNRPLFIGTEDQTTVVSSYSNAFQFDSNPYPIGAGEYAVLSDTGFTIGTVSRRDKENFSPSSLLLAD